jgi:hypothetical protein
MKLSDDYQAKLRFWAANQIVAPLPEGPSLPKFRPQKFATHLEMNRWKEALLLEVARKQVTHG